MYKAGFATTQEAYELGFDAFFAALDKAEAVLSQSRYLTGDRLTLADVRIFPTLIRLDVLYNGVFKLNLKVSLPSVSFFLSLLLSHR